MTACWVGSFGTGASISRIWVEHPRRRGDLQFQRAHSGQLPVPATRSADGINVNYADAKHRGHQKLHRPRTGDESLADMAGTPIQEKLRPRQQRSYHCTGQLPFLANGAPFYGGPTTVSRGFALLGSSPTAGGIPCQHYFPVSFTVSGTNVAQRCGTHSLRRL